MPNIPLTAVLAKLILLRNSKELPEPEAITTLAGHIDIELATFDDFRAWRRACGGTAAATRIWELSRDDGRKHVHEVEIDDWSGSGWSVAFQFNEHHGERGPSLDDDTTVALMRAVGA